MKACENCGKEHTGTYGSGRFCSSKCARGFSTKAKRKEINERLKKPKIKKRCLECDIEFNVFSTKRLQKFCSCKCSVVYNNRLNRKQRSDKMKKFINSSVEIKQKYKENLEKGRKLRKYNSLSDEHKRKISLNNKGGRCLWYEIEKNNGNKVKIQGSYELRFAKILNIIDENWIKPSIWNREHQFQWFDKNKKSHWYTPDFWSPKLQKYFEIKGFWKKDDKEKGIFVSSLKNVEIVYKKDLEKYEAGVV
jgi:hypothetical protein